MIWNTEMEYTHKITIFEKEAKSYVYVKFM